MSATKDPPCSLPPSSPPHLCSPLSSSAFWLSASSSSSFLGCYCGSRSPRALFCRTKSHIKSLKWAGSKESSSARTTSPPSSATTLSSSPALLGMKGTLRISRQRFYGSGRSCGAQRSNSGARVCAGTTRLWSALSKTKTKTLSARTTSNTTSRCRMRASRSWSRGMMPASRSWRRSTTPSAQNAPSPNR
ncbi:hypothetical protein C8R46DRAFT_1058276 [Mycena filopes]|nr:hypothetical protein C8R46DRAFT_1058276 [Mycena filopes]